MALHRHVTAGALAALLLAGAADGALGALTWGAPRPVGETYQTYNGMDGEMAPGGAAVLGWDSDTTAVVALAPEGEGFGPPHVFPSSRNPSVAVSEPGAAVAVMAAEGGPGVIVSRRGVDGWSAPETIDANSVSSAIGMDADGRAVVAWRSSADGGMHAARMTAGGDWGDPEDLAPADAGAQDPHLATSPDGVTTVVWRSSSGPVTRLMASSSDGGPWTPAEEIGSVSGLIVVPQLYGSPVLAGPGGEVTVVWSEGTAGGWSVRAARRTGGAWSDLPPVADVTGTLGVAWPVRAADGAIHVVNVGFGSGWPDAGAWRAARLAPGDAAWTDAPLPSGPGGAYTPLVVGGQDPGGGVVWARLAATSAGAGGFGPFEVLGASGGTLADRAAAALVLGSPARALAVWAVPQNADGTGSFALRASEGRVAADPVAPAPDAAAAPALAPPPALDRTPPVLRLGRMRLTVPAARRRGGRVLSATVTLSEAARVRAVLRRLRPGARPIVVRRVTQDLPAGVSRLRLGPVPAGAGTYRLTVTSLDAAGNAGAAARASFRPAPAR